MTAEPAEAIEWAGDAATVSALVKLQAAMRATRFLGVVKHHRRLIASRAKAGRNKCEWRKLHISPSSVATATGFIPVATLSTLLTTARPGVNILKITSAGKRAAAREAPGDEREPAGSLSYFRDHGNHHRAAARLLVDSLLHRVVNDLVEQVDIGVSLRETGNARQDGSPRIVHEFRR